MMKKMILIIVYLKEKNKIDIKIDDNNDEASHIIKVNSK